MWAAGRLVVPVTQVRAPGEEGEGWKAVCGGEQEGKMC